MKTPADDLPAIGALVRAAGDRVMELRKNPLVKTHKSDRSIVTNADHAANDLLRRELRRRYPDHGLLSEETGWEGPASSSHRWLIDPLDGTRAYARGEAGFSVMVGLLREGRPILGVVYDPWTDRLYEAAAGAGAYLTEGGRRRRLRVSAGPADGPRATITSTGFPEALRDRLGRSSRLDFLSPINSVGIKVGYLVRGEAAVYLNHHVVHHWDTAGPLAILEEAGGRMTHWDGSALTYNENGRHAHPGPTVASNGLGHDALVERLRAIP